MTLRETERNTKYDRQIRLWADNGQKRLEQGHVCLINANPAGAETLKNLVLPGIGAFTIMDDRTVCETDLSGNFFLEEEHVGLGIAGAMTESLQELNPDVKGQFLEILVDRALAKPELWTLFSIVVVSGFLKPDLVRRLADFLWDQQVPLLLVSTSGFYATLHIISKETTIVETHDPSKTFDLRIDCPWPELAAFSASFDMDLLDDTEHAHVPYIVIFIKALEQWKADHGGRAPLNYSEKREFRSEYVERMSRNINIETNFIEAAQSVHRALQITQVPNSLRQLFNRDEVVKDGANFSDFWLHVRALKSFIDTNEGQLPLPGNIPDMASTTHNYVQLQKIYRNKADADKQKFTSELSRVYTEAGRSADEINPGFVASFCKNAAFLFVSNGSKSQVSESLIRQLSRKDGADSSASEHHDLTIYFGILALYQWMDEGKTGGFDAFINCFEKITSISKEALAPAVSNFLKELFIHDTPSYHNICSLIGGIAGQEALKIATEQYIPLDNLYIFDGVRSASSKWRV
ncbi:hypothetical protein METBIDRAFT_34755 [Metschnikowia bicuspidata var. bicuspidata NRRL YB-4993]|uniref:NEDD8-activating enzyme E1 regulatory subunit n=1 Tax=Metschnikowia bicuspidata var. bicuspidata NRRL YB-4993 TaxID=869754 RepID=A0A1A0HHZ3_9ASCO|nr:hypothetical protein METBIDRAFT_34755 [Metschnikowia bicuspidata var. bicuspidata NRRL YB-4993]OBA23463.1 hypothetical protein METBIDRAFT_34755 [Metschnikowia bicuspidata var. bicuspidata NRRL YB-4993]